MSNDEKSDRAVAALGALAHEHRLGLYRMLVARGPEGLAAGEIAARLDIPPSSLTFHVQALMHAGLVHQRRDGRQVIYSADFEAMSSLVGFLTENCCRQSARDCGDVCAPAARRRQAPRRIRA